MDCWTSIDPPRKKTKKVSLTIGKGRPIQQRKHSLLLQLLRAPGERLPGVDGGRVGSGEGWRRLRGGEELATGNLDGIEGEREMDGSRDERRSRKDHWRRGGRERGLEI